MDDKYDFDNILKNKSYEIMWLELSDQSDFLHRWYLYMALKINKPNYENIQNLSIAQVVVPLDFFGEVWGSSLRKSVECPVVLT